MEVLESSYRLFFLMLMLIFQFKDKEMFLLGKNNSLSKVVLQPNPCLILQVDVRTSLPVHDTIAPSMTPLFG
jgi:hypothetical protein